MCFYIDQLTFKLRIEDISRVLNIYIMMLRASKRNEINSDCTSSHWPAVFKTYLNLVVDLSGALAR